MKTNRILYILLAISLSANLWHWGMAVPPDYDTAAGGATAPGYKLVTAVTNTAYTASRGFLLDDASPGAITYLDGEGTSQTLSHLNGGIIYPLRVTKVTSYSGTCKLVY